MRNVAAHNFEEQRGSKNGKACGKEPISTNRKHQVKPAVCSTPLSKKKRSSRSSRTWAHGNNASTEQAQQCRTPYQETVWHQQWSSGPWNNDTRETGTMNTRDGTGNKKLSELEYKQKEAHKVAITRYCSDQVSARIAGSGNYGGLMMSTKERGVVRGVQGGYRHASHPLAGYAPL